MTGKTSRVLTIGAIVLVMAGAGLVLSLDSLVHQSKEAIRRELERAIGREVAFDTVELDFWGPPTLAINNLTVPDDPRFAATPFVHARQLKVSIRWFSLLTGKPEITGLVLEEPEIQLIRNEYGDVNIFKPTEQGAAPPRFPPLRLPGTGVEAHGGSLHFIDRTSKTPTELRLRDLSIDLTRSKHDKISVHLAGALAVDEEDKPFTVKGTIGPLATDSDWLHNPLDLELQVSALPRAIVSRSLAMLEDKVPAFLHISGPLEINAHVSGTINQPRVTQIELKGSLFGSNRQNATLKAAIDFAKDSAWEHGLVKARLDLENVTLEQLKQIPSIGRILPRELVVEGSLNIQNTIDGRISRLTARTTLNAKDNEIRYGQWFIKRPGVRADLALVTHFSSERILIDESVLHLYNGKFILSGSMIEKPEQAVQLRVKTVGVPMRGWENLTPLAEGYEIDGELTAELSIYKRTSPRDEPPVLRGRLQIADTHAISKERGERNFEGVNADIRFQGKDIEVRNFELRSGTSDIALKGQLASLRRPIFYYSLQATNVRLSDLTRRADHRNDLFRHLSSEGVMEFIDGIASIKGNLTSSDGHFREAGYRNLRTQLDWTPRGLKFNDLSFESLGGIIKAYGGIHVDPQLKLRVRLSPTIRNVDLKRFVALVSPGSEQGVSGSIDLEGQFSGAGEDWDTLSQTLNGHARMDLRNGVIENFNLMRGVLASLHAVQGIRSITAAGPEFTSLVQSGKTPFSSIKATFGIEKGRVFSDDLTMRTPDYAITSGGWLDADGRLDWEANLVLSSAFSRALSTRNRNVRYLLDDRDVMSIPFRLKGKVPRIEVKPEVGQLLRFMHARVAEENTRGRKSARDDAEESGLWNSFRQSSDDLWNSFRRLFR